MDSIIKEVFVVYDDYDWNACKHNWVIKSIKVRKTKSLYITEDRCAEFDFKSRFDEGDLVFSKEEAINKKIRKIELSIDTYKRSIQGLERDLELIKKIPIGVDNE